ncbi:hypothetical protein LBMAG57_38450 [Verrucomicrobiota bacterium]|nr:hypothetical protein LBMAG57_38450 [Verrucomicrobiota bacterium]
MKIALLLVSILLSSNSINAQQAAPEPPLVNTTGTAEIKVAPDLADLYFEVEVRHSDLATARKQQSERAAKVLAAIRALGVTEADLQAADISIIPNYTAHDRERAETAEVRFFTVSQRIEVTIKDVKKVPDFIAATAAAGATEARSVGLRTSQFRKHRDAARANAIKAAREKAVALASVLGSKVGKPYRIFEGAAPWSSGSNGFSPPQIPQGANAALTEEPDDGPAGAAFAIGTISITATISVSFLLE